MLKAFKKIKMEQIIIIAVVSAILACCMFIGSCVARNHIEKTIIRPELERSEHITAGNGHQPDLDQFIYLETREFLDPSGNTIYAVSFLDTETGMASDAVAYSEEAYRVIMGFLGEEVE
jgi:hypothetical protein